MLMTSLIGLLSSQSLLSATFQAPDSINSGNSKLLLFFVAVAAFALLAQFLVIFGIGIVVYKAQKTVMDHIGEIKGKVYPIVAKTESLLTELSPKISDITSKVNTIAAHAEHIASVAKAKADEFSPTISAANRSVANATETFADANRKTRAQIGRVDAMVSGALDATVRIGVALEKGISAPGREIAGFVSGLKHGLETLVNGARGFAAGGVKAKAAPAQQPTTSAYRVAANLGQPRVDKPEQSF